jgi:hypothetical protein
MDNTQVGLAGEYYVLAQLTQRGFVATLTLANTKGVDILVTNQELNKLFKVEVKTSTKMPAKSKLFGDGLFYDFPMGKKHEEIIDPNLIYCFVVLEDAESLPKFFIVPSEFVANQIKEQHQQWLNVPRKKPVKDTPLRKFRIPVEDPNEFENNWAVFSEYW